MFPAVSLLAACLLALCVSATSVGVRGPPAILPLAKYINAAGGAISLVKRDQARAAALRDRGIAVQDGKLDRRAVSIPDTNVAFSYIASIGVGSPPTTYNLVVDSGSANTWIGAGTAYKQTSTSVDTSKPVSAKYGNASFSGEEWTDTVTLGSGLVITKQSIGVASTSTGFAYDGILGIGPEILTMGTLTNEPLTEIPTVTQNLYSQGTISQEVVGVFFAPTTTESSTNGELTFGGVDPAKYTGTIAYTPLTLMFPASKYWGVDGSVTYGSTTILAQTAGIVDTGTTLTLLSSDAFSAYQSATGGVMDDATGLLKFTAAQYNALQNLNFNIGSLLSHKVTYQMIPNAQIWPRSLNTYIGGTADSIYSIVSSLGTPSGAGLDFVHGQTFLERFYSVLDTTNSRVGFARTEYTYATTN